MKNKKGSGTILLLIALMLMFVTKTIGNVIIGGLAVVFGLAVAASIVTAMVGDFMRKRKEEDDA
ncbi:hypothetical protein [Bacillus mycoides]|uniref:hypothetical protein n=1 Tax=Bacillus mycoides TaxID=1405 RepID=UPI000A27CB25|nr:hypothetical protein [Bacillus mycoides]OSX87811.1 hypothetical protein BTJ44_03488 [Bacillus mycoides]